MNKILSIISLAIGIFSSALFAQITFERWYGGTAFDIGNYAIPTTDGGYACVGKTYNFGADNGDVFLIKTDANGNVHGIKESNLRFVMHDDQNATIISGPVYLPKDKICKVFDIMGQVVTPDQLKPGVYFIQIDNKIVQKIVKVR